MILILATIDLFLVFLEVETNFDGLGVVDMVICIV